MTDESPALALPVEPAPLARTPPPAGWLARWFPHRNPPAVSGYYFGIFGLAPVVGALLGPMAFSLGVIGLWRAIEDPDARGGNHAVFAIIAGFLETVLNWAALIVYFALLWVFAEATPAE